MSGTKFQARVLDRNNLNQAYLRVKRRMQVSMYVRRWPITISESISAEITWFIGKWDLSSHASKTSWNSQTQWWSAKAWYSHSRRLSDLASCSSGSNTHFWASVSDSSFGFRPHRSAHDAIQQVIDLYNQGYHCVVDLDLKAYFDTDNHDLMMKLCSGPMVIEADSSVLD